MAGDFFVQFDRVYRQTTAGAGCCYNSDELLDTAVYYIAGRKMLWTQWSWEFAKLSKLRIIIVTGLPSNYIVHYYYYYQLLLVLFIIIYYP